MIEIDLTSMVIGSEEYLKIMNIIAPYEIKLGEGLTLKVFHSVSNDICII